MPFIASVLQVGELLPQPAPPRPPVAPWCPLPLPPPPPPPALLTGDHVIQLSAPLPPAFPLPLFAKLPADKAPPPPPEPP